MRYDVIHAINIHMACSTGSVIDKPIIAFISHVLSKWGKTDMNGVYESFKTHLVYKCTRTCNRNQALGVKSIQSNMLDNAVQLPAVFTLQIQLHNISSDNSQ
ncbi:hypothetical protein O5D80_000851 [Batrachochytrium dendrobatidis]|nr:hypothetical protein O5D80_000851 [Batrachochytrium dendrobatidis]